MTELTSEIARKLGFNIPSHEGENLSDQLIELASNDEVILQSVAKWFKLGPLKVSMIISEYIKSQKKVEMNELYSKLCLKLMKII
ncbi:unnamed protein product [Blepharisma stoltei]|uniref:Uncharacterized protein n=1 Tax=Blepharisma stoltei TaxID=1481888 RepID=A0AAU9IGN3_9CILI|nr:unnamed protein product [Blepharisma stoltei]